MPAPSTYKQNQDLRGSSGSAETFASSVTSDNALHVRGPEQHPRPLPPDGVRAPGRRAKGAESAESSGAGPLRAASVSARPAPRPRDPLRGVAPPPPAASPGPHRVPGSSDPLRLSGPGAG
uniref:translation initiation factor IF-2-like n=1 Tax=Nyctereutes procyonoides TaxID=34880 RepID=UPI002444C671|nr:translation initiation factor IF-2-like [Nyctereutes procyonoides]